MTNAPSAHPEFYLQAHGSPALERLDIAIWTADIRSVDAICTRMIKALVAAGYDRFELYDPKTDFHPRSYKVEGPEQVVTAC